MRTIADTFRYRYRISELKREGADFRMHVYVPEMDPITVDFYHEREDHCHILKRIWKHAGEKGPEVWRDLTKLCLTPQLDCLLPHSGVRGNGQCWMQNACCHFWWPNFYVKTVMRQKESKWRYLQAGMRQQMAEV